MIAHHKPSDYNNSTLTQRLIDTHEIKKITDRHINTQKNN